MGSGLNARKRSFFSTKINIVKWMFLMKISMGFTILTVFRDFFQKIANLKQRVRVFQFNPLTDAMSSGGMADRKRQKYRENRVQKTGQKIKGIPERHP
jgi:hypothetical protein